MIISKLDNELSQLLKAQITFLNNPEAQATLSISLQEGQLADFIDEKSLKREIEDLCDLKMVAGEIAFLDSIGRLKKEFVSYFNKNRYVIPKIVKNKGVIEEISVTGNLVDLILLEFPLVCVIREHVIYRQIEMDRISYDSFMNEAIRRLQTKIDIIRECNLNLYLGADIDRVSYDWAAVVMMLLIGELKESVVGTNHLLTAFVLDLPTEAFLNDKMWLEHWDKKDIALDIADSDGWWGARVPPNPSLIFDKPKDFKLLIDGSNLYNAMHFVQHNPDRNIIIELDKGLLDDFGYTWKELKVTKKIIKNK